MKQTTRKQQLLELISLLKKIKIQKQLEQDKILEEYYYFVEPDKVNKKGEYYDKNARRTL